MDFIGESEGIQQFCCKNSRPEAATLLSLIDPIFQFGFGKKGVNKNLAKYKRDKTAKHCE